MRRLGNVDSDVWVAAGLFLLVCIVFFPFLITNDFLIYNNDITYFYPHERVIRHSFSQNEFPLWNPYFGGGSPQLGKLQDGLLYPPAVVLRAFLPIVTMFNWEVVLHVYLAGLGIYVLLRDMGVGRFSAVFCGVAFMFSGIIIPRVLAGHVSILRTVGWIGWLLWAYRLLLKEYTWYRLLLTVLFMVLVILGGHPQVSLIVLFVPLSYFFFAFLPAHLAENRRVKALKGFLYSSLAVFLAFGITAVQLIPFVEWFSKTTRGQGLSIDSFEFMTRNSIELEHLLTPFFPLLWFDPQNQQSFNLTGFSHFWEVSPFVGVTLIVFLAAGWLLANERKKMTVYYFVGLMFLGLFLSMGRINPAYQWFFSELPIFRGPGRFVIWWVFSITVLAGLHISVLTEIIANGKERSRLKKIAFLIFILFIISLIATAVWTKSSREIAVSLAGGVGSNWERFDAKVRQSLIVFAVTLVLNGIILWIGQQKEWGVVLWKQFAFTVLLVEILLFVTPLLKPYPVTLLNRPDHPMVQLDLDASKHRFVGYREPPNYLLPTLVDVSNGEVYYFLATLLEGKDQGIYLLSAGFIADSELRSDPELELKQQTGTAAYLYEFERNLPRIYLATGAKLVEKEEDALKIVTDPTFSPFTQAFVTSLESDEPANDEIELPVDGLEQAKFTAEYTSYSMNSFTAEITTDRPGMVVFAEMYYPGWEAAVDGVPVRIWRTNYAFRGVLVNQGTHLVEMAFRPISFQIGLIISTSTFLLMVVTTVINLCGRKITGNQQ